jgi:hypothetical protein
MKGTYYRWTRVRAGVRGTDHEILSADILGAEVDINADPSAGTVTATIPSGPMDPDTARMIGVRLIEAAVIADNDRSVREP